MERLRLPAAATLAALIVATQHGGFVVPLVSSFQPSSSLRNHHHHHHHRHHHRIPHRSTMRLPLQSSATSSSSSDSSAASKWMENEKRIEDEMDVAAAAAAAAAVAVEETDETGNKSTTTKPATTTKTATTTTKTATVETTTTNSPPPTYDGGRWELLHGNHVLRPPPSANGGRRQPRALLHFLGGALVGAAPKLTYRYLLERLASNGYLVVATPYQLSFDHLTTCDEIVGSFERVAPELAREYGAVPVVGVGHSCGALLHMLITSLFPDTPRAANALISYNNKGVGEAVPLFEEVFVPLFGDRDRNGSKLMKAAIAVAREQSNGKVPSDEALLQLLKSVPVPIPGLNLESILTPSAVTIPPQLRQSLTDILTEPAYEALSNAPAIGNVPALLLQSLDIAQQIPKLIDEVEGGARDFVPTPDAMSSAARRAYRCRRTLLVQFENDALDESEALEGYLKEAESVMKMKRPMITIDLQRKRLGGNHLTPLLGPSGGEGWGEKLEETLGGVLDAVGGGDKSDPDEEEEDANASKSAKTVRETLGYDQVERVVDELVAWLDEGSL